MLEGEAGASDGVCRPVGGTATLRSRLLWREVFVPNGQLLEECLTKLCFGTDTSYFAGNHDFARYVDFHERLFDQMGVPAALREKICSGNVLSFFGLD